MTKESVNKIIDYFAGKKVIDTGLEKNVIVKDNKRIFIRHVLRYIFESRTLCRKRDELVCRWSEFDFKSLQQIISDSGWEKDYKLEEVQATPDIKGKKLEVSDRLKNPEARNLFTFLDKLKK